MRSAVRNSFDGLAVGSYRRSSDGSVILSASACDTQTKQADELVTSTQTVPAGRSAA